MDLHRALLPCPAEMTRQQILADPDLQRRLIMLLANPAIAGALTSPDQFERVFNEMSRQRAAYEQQSQQEMCDCEPAKRNLQNADSMDVEAQKRIAEEIRKANVAQNMEKQSSITQNLLVELSCCTLITRNGHHVKAFVDSGAQATIMSPECAEACHVMHLLDERFAGVAHGVGTAKILGRIHSTQIKVGKSFLPCSLTVMEACIDLASNVLRINHEEVPFLPEHELPDKAKLEHLALLAMASFYTLYNQLMVHRLQLLQRVILEKVATQTTQPSASTHAVPTASTFSETSIQSLVDLGATREQAINALEACGGNGYGSWFDSLK
ncbi:hypothetical protein BSLG_005758 [Batrachochytrium salamandrivorans]|nr:hypothetical protein BSLG_005758 [Batrachochytrium salamandrivorans]